MHSISGLGARFGGSSSGDHHDRAKYSKDESAAEEPRISAAEHRNKVGHIV